MKYKVSSFNYISPCLDGTLRLYNSMNGMNSLLMVDRLLKDDVLSVLNGTLPVDVIPEYVKAALIHHGYLVPENKDEDYAVKIKMAETVLDDKYLNLIIMPTEQCNFRCKYCYETFEKGKMTKETQDSIIKYVQKNILNYVGLSVVWFGGEPLLALDVVEYLSENFIKICKAGKRTYVSGMTTNGYNLTPDVFDKLYKLKILNYQITLDGFRTQHDSQRVLAGGGGTFDRIVNNLVQIKNKKAFGTVFNIRTNFTKAIIENIDEYLDFYKQTFGNDPRFSFYVQQAGDWGGERVKDFSEKLADSVYGVVLHKMKEHGITFGRASHFSELQGELNTCYAAKKNSLVIGSDGMVYKCTVHFDLPENQVGKLHENGTIELNENFLKWIRPFSEMDVECSNCYNRAACYPMKCPYALIRYGKAYCPPMSGGNFKVFLECFDDSLFSHLSPEHMADTRIVSLKGEVQ